MYAIIDMIASTVDIVALSILVMFVPSFVFFTLRARRGHRFPLRPIGVYSRLKELVSEATESGRPVHVGMGSGQLGTEETAQAGMGLAVFDYVARQAVAANQPVTGTVGDSSTLAAAQGVIQQAAWDVGFPGAYADDALAFCGPDRFAYAAGVVGMLQRGQHLANVLIGHFEAEGLLMAEMPSGPPMARIGGTVDPASAMLMRTSLDHAVVGEEVFAAGAYLHRKSHLGSLAAQDLMRIVIIVSIVAGVIMSSLGLWR